jgi:ATP-binding cassette subfamily B protein
MFDAGAEIPAAVARGSWLLGSPGRVATQGRPVLDGKNLSFRYPNAVKPALQDTSVTIRSGERILVEGPSGGGTSPLCALLAGVRVPDTGLLLLRGLDRATLGPDGWRKRVVAAPQFHDNRIFCGSLAFNVLMGRRWPASPADIQEAEDLCRELGMGALIDRMPGGMLQVVGETGWRLSHGEQSRVFVARALLQRAEMVILDESLGALDPENQQRTLACVLRRAPTLMIAAHP